MHTATHARARSTKQVLAEAATVTTSLSPYNGTFGRQQAYHLLRRSTFGVTLERVAEAEGLGLNATLDRLLTDDDFDGLPINVEGRGDPNVPVGETWITSPYVQGFDVNPYRQRSLQAWQMRSYYRGGFSAQAKMSLFWNNHFAVFRDNADARLYYYYLDTLRRNALGNFSELVRAITVNPAMLRFLNGNQNLATSPNENYARELLELFTLGKGDLAGPGDYTTYTEDDVRAIARALTGWTARGINSTNADIPYPEPIFIASRHDTGTKQLSARFGGQTIANAGDREYSNVIDIVFAHPLSADYLCRKLYRWFVYYDITPEVEADIIQPLAATLRNSDFEVVPVLRQLLGSEHFFAMRQRGGMIASPIDFSIAALASLEFAVPDDMRLEHAFMLTLTGACANQQMVPSQPPSVAGWKAYYQAPLYSRSWINAATLKARSNFTDAITTEGLMLNNRVSFQHELLDLLRGFDNPSDPNDVVAEFVERLLPEPLTQEQLDTLKSVLVPGLPDFEWTVEYNQHLASPNDAGLRESLERKLRLLAKTVFTAAEAHLS